MESSAGEGSGYGSSVCAGTRQLSLCESRALGSRHSWEGGDTLGTLPRTALMQRDLPAQAAGAEAERWAAPHAAGG